MRLVSRFYDHQVRRQLVSSVFCRWSLSSTALVSGTFPSPATGIDDANIFFVYARNVSAGDGFVFNPGRERVEGFTSLLWVLIAGLVTAVTTNPKSHLSS